VARPGTETGLAEQPGQALEQRQPARDPGAGIFHCAQV